MRVMHVIKDLEPGGIQTLLLDMLLNKQYFGGSTAVFTMGRGRLQDCFRHSNIPLYETRQKWKLDFHIVSQLREAVADFEADIVHTHHSAEMLHAHLALRKNRQILRAHTYHVSPAVNSWIDHLVFKLLEKRSDLLLTPSVTLKEEMKGYGYSRAEDYRVLPNGIDPDRARNELPKEECRRILQLPEEAYIIGMAGTFYNDIRDQETLCRAVPLLAKFDKPVYVVFAGASQSDYFREALYFSKCQKLCVELGVKDRVLFPGHISPVKIFMGALDIYVHSSKRDTFGLAPVEALYNNLPVLVSDVKVFREILGDDERVEFFIPSDPQSLAEAINKKIAGGLYPGRWSPLTERYTIKNFLRELNRIYSDAKKT